MRSHLRTFLFPVLGLLTVLAFSIFTALRHPHGSPLAAVGASLSPSGSTKTYADPTYGFSFDYPDDLRVQNVPSDTGYFILAEKPNAPLGFQVFILPFDEPAPITAARIEQELPHVMASESLRVMIGSQRDIPALLFHEGSESLGTTTEIWFVWPPNPLPNGNYLYEVTTYAADTDWLTTLLDTWRFNN